MGEARSARREGVKETGLIFSSEMALANVQGRKTMTRRVMKPQPELIPDDVPKYEGEEYWWSSRLHQTMVRMVPNGWQMDAIASVCPYGQVGDLIWQREAWATENRYNNLKPSELPLTAKIFYIADGYDPFEMGKIRPSIFMPKWASRWKRPITGIRAERLQEITEADAMAEGFGDYKIGQEYQKATGNYPVFALGVFKWYWDLKNAKRGYGWDLNKWVWPLGYENVIVTE